MYIFRRTRTMKPSAVLEARAFAVNIAAQASQVSGHPISALEMIFGSPAGSISWTTPVKDMADLGELMAGWAPDAGYVTAVAAGAKYFTDNATDNMFQLIANGIETTDSALYSTLAAVARPATLPDAVAFGLKTQAYLQQAGFATAFGPSTYGPFGEVGWIVAVGSMAELDRLHEFMATDPGYAELAASAVDLFEPGTGLRQLSLRIA
ncbi:MAG: hypothetical protein ACI89G_003127 [Minisyncoccia bacterium]|jgi:hypothetical protein